jgi:hypothetical protein
MILYICTQGENTREQTKKVEKKLKNFEKTLDKLQKVWYN